METTVVDVACGRGELLSALAAQADPSIQLVGVDVVPPPTAGLQLILAMVSRLPLTRAVRQPRRAAAAAASQPAWPAPTTITS